MDSSSSTCNMKKRGRATTSLKARNSRSKIMERRKQGITKKLSELTVLCGIEACLICITPEINGIDAWPDMAKAREMVDRFRGVPVKDQNKNKIDCSGLLLQRIHNLKQELESKRKDNMDLHNTPLSLDTLISKLSIDNSDTLLGHIDRKLSALNARIQFLTNPNSFINLRAPPTMLNFHEPSSLCNTSNIQLEKAHLSQQRYLPQLPMHLNHHSMNAPPFKNAFHGSMYTNPDNSFPFPAPQGFYAPHQFQIPRNGHMICSSSGDQLNSHPYPSVVNDLQPTRTAHNIGMEQGMGLIQ